MLNMLGSIAQWEREIIGERTALALQHKRESLSVYGPTPFDFRRCGKDLEIDADEQTEANTIRRMIARGF